MVNSCPPYPILRVLDSKAHVLHAIEATSTKKIIFRPKTEKNAIFRPETRPPPQMAIFFAPKRPILAQKQCFLGLGGQFKAPPRYFAGARLKKTCVVGYGSRKMGDSAPPPPPPPKKMAIFCPKKAQKCQFWAKNSVFWAWVAISRPPHPILQVLDSKKKHVLQHMGAGKWVNQGRRPQKMANFCPKKGLKMPFLGQKQCFLGSGGQFKAPAPYFAGSRLKKTYVAGYGSRKMGSGPPPPPPNGHFLPKKKA